MSDSQGTGAGAGSGRRPLPFAGAAARGRNQGIKLKTKREIALMREAGRVVAEALGKARELAAPGVTTAELNDAVAAVFKKYDATPLFLNYPNAEPGRPPFPAVICASVNEAVVHGIPNAKRPLKSGDVVAIDTGCKLNGWCGDSAVTLAIGEVSPELTRLLDVTRETLELAIRLIPESRTWSEVARRMEAHVRSHGMATVEKFVGHGIGQNMHEAPQVPNFVSRELARNDFALEPGLVLAIEPMVSLGTKEVAMLSDGWTIVTKDRRASAHFEHTVAITEDGAEILTLP